MFGRSETLGPLASTSARCGVASIGVKSTFPQQFSQEVALMETPKVPDTARSEMSLIGESVVIRGELSCSEDLYIGGQVEGAIELKGNRLTVGPNGRWFNGTLFRQGREART